MNRVVTVKADFKGEWGHEITDLENKVREVVNDHNKDGFKVVSVTNLVGSNQSTEGDYPYAESYTTGVLIIFEDTNQ
jgi:hypothetical protein